MSDDLDDLDPAVPVHLTKVGILKAGLANPEWFNESVQLSRQAIEAARAEIAKELEEAGIEVCQDDECGRVATVRGLCRPHYQAKRYEERER